MNTAAWSRADSNPPTPDWIRVTLNGTYNIYSVITKGRQNDDGGQLLQTVTEYELRYSTKDSADIAVRNSKYEIIRFPGNSDMTTKVENVLPDVIQATSVTLYPTAFLDRISLRFEVMGCDYNECLDNPCPTDRVCRNTVGSYECQCTNGWTGPNNCGQYYFCNP